MAAVLLPVLTDKHFIFYAKPIVKKGKDRDFRSLFGVSPGVCSVAWNLCRDNLPAKTEPKHFLWGLLLLKAHSKEAVLCSLTDSSRPTFRKWAWIVIHAIAAKSPSVVSCF